MKFDNVKQDIGIINEIRINTLTNMLKDDKRRQKLIATVKRDQTNMLGPKEIIDQSGDKLSRSEVDEYFKEYGIYNMTNAEAIDANINLVLNYYFS